MLCLRMRRDVRKRLLHDPVRCQLQVRRKPDGLAFELQSHRETVPGLCLLDEHLQGRHEAKILQVDRPQIANQTAEVDKFLINQAGQLGFDTLARPGGVCRLAGKRVACHLARWRSAINACTVSSWRS